MRPLASRPWFAIALLATFTSLAQPASIAGQVEDPEMIPREVAEALVAGGPFGTAGRDVRILTGRIPDHLARVVPTEAEGRVLGSLVRRHVTEAVLDVPGTPDQALTRWDEALLDIGWERFQPPTGRPSGFTASPPGRSHQFCMGDSLSISLDAYRHDGGSRLRIFAPEGRSAYNICRNRETAVERGRRSESPLPALTPPTGVRMRGSGGGGGGNAWDSRGLAETSTPVTELAEHYHRQLVRHGWESVGQAVSEDVVVYRYQVADEERDSPWLGLLSVARGHDTDERYLTLEARHGDW